VLQLLASHALRMSPLRTLSGLCVMILHMHAGGSAAIVESQFNMTASTVDFEICRLSDEQLVYLDGEMPVGTWRSNVNATLPMSLLPENTFLTEDHFFAVQKEVWPFQVSFVRQAYKFA
jgi:hypothetical protein